MLFQFIIFCSITSNIVLFIILYLLKNKIKDDKVNYYKQLSNKTDYFINLQRKAQIEYNTLKKNIEDLNEKITSLNKENNGLKERNKQLEDDSKIFDPEHKDLIKILYKIVNTLRKHIKKYKMFFTKNGECVYYKETGEHNYYYYDDSKDIEELINKIKQKKIVNKNPKETSNNNSSNQQKLSNINEQSSDDDEPVRDYLEG